MDGEGVNNDESVDPGEIVLGLEVRVVRLVTDVFEENDEGGVFA
jgi:hypothetical protein